MGGDLLLLTEFKTSTNYIRPNKGKKQGSWLASEMAQPALALLTKPGHLSSTPRILMLEGENQSPLVAL